MSRMAHAIRPWRTREEAGQSLVEFAMILPVFLLLLFALVDFGRGFYSWMIVTNAAREGARAAAVGLNDAGIDTKIRDSYCDGADCSLEPGKMFVTKTNTVSQGGTRGQQTTVTIAYDFDYVTPIGDLLHLVSGGSISEPTIHASSSMRLE